MQISCTLHAKLMRISCKSQVRLRYNSGISVISQSYLNKSQSNIRKLLRKSQAYLRHNSDSPKAYLRHILVTDVMFLNYIYVATLLIMQIYDDDNDILCTSQAYIRHKAYLSTILIFLYCLSETIMYMQLKIGQILLYQMFHTLVFTLLVTWVLSTPNPLNSVNIL